MEIAIKGVLGALVAISLHFAVSSRYYYLAGLIPLFPTFALFAHTMFASGGRAMDMQISAQFGMLSLVPYGVYLLLVWWLALRMNLWFTLSVATVGWAAVALIIVLLWNSSGAWTTSLLYNPLWIALAAASYVVTWAFAKYSSRKKTPQSQGAQSVCVAGHGLSRWRSRARLVATGSGARTYVALTDAEPKNIVDELLEHAEADIAAQRLTMPPGNNAWERFKAVLFLDPNNTTARQGLLRVVSRYIALAKRADAAGKTDRAAIYLNRARSVLFGTRVQTETGVN